MYSTASRQLAVPQLSNLGASAWLLHFLTAAAPQAQRTHRAHSAAAAVVLNGAKLPALPWTPCGRCLNHAMCREQARHAAGVLWLMWSWACHRAPHRWEQPSRRCTSRGCMGWSNSLNPLLPLHKSPGNHVNLVMFECALPWPPPMEGHMDRALSQTCSCSECLASCQCQSLQLLRPCSISCPHSAAGPKPARVNSLAWPATRQEPYQQRPLHAAVCRHSCAPSSLAQRPSALTAPVSTNL